jgi:molybdopterin molybdotransferase
VIDLETARRRLWAVLPGPVETEEVPLAAAAGRVLAAPLLAEGHVPPVPRAAEDGFAVRCAELAAAQGLLRVAGSAWPGGAPPPLPPGAAARVPQGAAVPAGADAVVAIAHAEVDAAAETVRVAAGAWPRPGRGVTAPGQEVAAGEEVLPAGSVLTAECLAALAAAGVRSVRAHRRPRIAVLPIGDELVRMPGGGVPAAVADGNGPALAACLARDGAEAVRWAPCGDDAAALGRAVGMALSGADAVITTGGVALGPREVLERVVAGLGGEVLFHWVAIEPGASSLAARFGHTLLLGLPGHPPAALAAYELLAVPVVRRLAGLGPGPVLTGRLGTASVLPPSRAVRLVRAELADSADGLLVWPLRERAGSILSLLRGNGYYVHPAGDGDLPAGAVVEVQRADRRF